MNNKDFKLECAFLHKSLVLQLLDDVMRQLAQEKIENILQTFDGGLRETFINTVLSESVVNILKINQVPSLESLLANECVIEPGQLVWFEQEFYFKGTIAARGKYDRGINPSYAEFHTKLNRYGEIRIQGEFNAAHLFGDSSVGNLSGRKNVFLFAFIKNASVNLIKLRPVFIGSKMIASNNGFHLTTDHLYVSIEDIDEFCKVKEVSRRGLNMNILKNIPEKQIKHWLAEIIDENNVPKDWGGEKSDLFTNHIHIAGRRLCAAFLLKGPSNFTPMTVKNLGANGDQISRLYDEPADLYILQHCHYIKPEIYKNMRAFSGNFTKMSRFCLIDGEDTLRILKAYDKI